MHASAIASATTSGQQTQSIPVQHFLSLFRYVSEGPEDVLVKKGPPVHLAIGAEEDLKGIHLTTCQRHQLACIPQHLVCTQSCRLGVLLAAYQRHQLACIDQNILLTIVSSLHAVVQSGKTRVAI